MTIAAQTSDTGTGPLAGEHRLLIDGELVQASDGGTIDNVNPSTGEIAGTASSATADDMERAIAAARRAFDEGTWANDPEFRSRCLMQLHEAIVEEREHLRRVIITESGSPISLTYAVQLQQPIDESKYWAEMARDFVYEYELEPHEFLGRLSRRIMRYEATGVVAAITPWNYPFYLNVAESVPALAAGNAVILKPAQLTPWSGLELGRLVAEKTDIPAGIFQVLTTADHDVTEMLTTDPASTWSPSQGRHPPGAACSQRQQTPSRRCSSNWAESPRTSFSRTPTSPPSSRVLPSCAPTPVKGAPCPLAFSCPEVATKRHRPS